MCISCLWVLGEVPYRSVGPWGSSALSYRRGPGSVTCLILGPRLKEQQLPVEGNGVGRWHKRGFVITV